MTDGQAKARVNGATYGQESQEPLSEQYKKVGVCHEGTPHLLIYSKSKLSHLREKISRGSNILLNYSLPFLSLTAPRRLGSRK